MSKKLKFPIILIKQAIMPRHSNRYYNHINSLRRIAEITGLPHTFRVPCPLLPEYEYDFKIFMRYMNAYPYIWNDIMFVEYISHLP
jgi:hypothetical protein